MGVSATHSTAPWEGAGDSWGWMRPEEKRLFFSFPPPPPKSDFYSLVALAFYTAFIPPV